MVAHLLSVLKVLGFLLNPNPHTLFLLSTGSDGKFADGVEPRQCGTEGVCGRHCSTDRATLAWALLGSKQGSIWKPAGSTFAPEPCPVSPAPAHLLFLRTSPRRCPGRWGPRAAQSTPRPPRPGSGSISLASCAPRGWTLAAARVAGTAGRDWRPWLSASGSFWAQGRCTARTEQRRVLP